MSGKLPGRALSRDERRILERLQVLDRSSTMPALNELERELAELQHERRWREQSTRGVHQAPASPSPEPRESRGPRSHNPQNNKSRARGRR